MFAIMNGLLLLLLEYAYKHTKPIYLLGLA